MNAQQVRRSGGFDLPCSADTAFPLFSPEGERAWVKEWDPRPVFPASIEFRRDTVFRMGEGEAEAIWTIVDADWETHRAEYVRVAPASHAARIVVKIDIGDGASCRVRVSYTITAMGEHGHALLESFSEDGYAERMQDWRRQISSHLESVPR